jgi:AraC-like DNA-binding protein
MIYREHAPGALLAPWIECIWTRTEPAPGGQAHRVLPDGCADILFDFAAPGGARAIVVGPMTRAILVPSRPRERYLGVRFRPGGAGAFLRVPLSGLLDASVDLGDVWTEGARVHEQVAEAREKGGEVAAIARELRARLARWPAPRPRLGALVAQVAVAPEGVSVESLAAAAGITRQHLTRLFQAEVGYGPKMLSRILRLRRALRLLDEPGRGPLSAVALDAGYYDQSHMNADFRELAGAPPTFHSSKTFPPRAAILGP